VYVIASEARTLKITCIVLHATATATATAPAVAVAVAAAAEAEWRVR